MAQNQLKLVGCLGAVVLYRLVNQRDLIADAGLPVERLGCFQHLFGLIAKHQRVPVLDALAGKLTLATTGIENFHRRLAEAWFKVVEQQLQPNLSFRGVVNITLKALRETVEVVVIGRSTFGSVVVVAGH